MHDVTRSTPQVPNPNWTGRNYQRPVWHYLANGGKRAFTVWHRRAGKDEIFLQWSAASALWSEWPGRVGTYWYMLPEASQARKAIWEAINPHTGFRRIDEIFPRSERETTREQDMMIRFKNGSTWQVVGSDNYNSLVGSPPVGVVFSEWALANPTAWAYLRPILLENGGWAAFNTTPRGRNHAWRMLRAHQDDPDWFVEVLSAEQSGVFSAEQLEQELKEYIAEYGESEGKGRFEQEYLCSFDAGIPGAYYADFIRKAEQENRVTRVPWEPKLPVYTAWDLGRTDSTAIWFAQLRGREIGLIDYYEDAGKALQHYAKIVTEKPYMYGHHILPHDIEVTDYTADASRLEILEELGFRNKITVAPKLLVDDGIQAVRSILPRCVFDSEKTEKGLDALRLYHREWDANSKQFHKQPKHDWTSHAADAFRYLAIGLDERKINATGTMAELDYEDRAQAPHQSAGTVIVQRSDEYDW